MENQTKTCSSKKHENNEAISYCQLCRVYTCEKCEAIHKELYNHPLINIKNDSNNIISGFCEEEDHNMKLDFYCRNHNVLCCAACISKLKLKGNGQHSGCEISIIDEIKEEKKNNLHNNIKVLEEMKDNVEELTNEMKKMIGKINKSKEVAKERIKEIFIKLRNALNEREKILLNEVDNKMANIFFDEKMIQKSEYLPKSIQLSLEKAKLIDKNWEENNALLSIKNCILVENSINDIKTITKRIENSHTYEIGMSFSPDEQGIEKFINAINNFGDIVLNNFIFQKSKMNTNDDNNYEVSGELNNIIIKTGKIQKWICALCSNKFIHEKENIWKIRILNTRNFQILVGVAPLSMNIQYIASRLGLPGQTAWNFNYNFNQTNQKTNVTNTNWGSFGKVNTSWQAPLTQKYTYCGWYFYCFDSKLYSDKPQSYKGQETRIKKVRDEIKIVMNMEKRSLKFIVNNEDLGESYTDIPIDEPLTPAVLLYDENDSVEIITLK